MSCPHRSLLATFNKWITKLIITIKNENNYHFDYRSYSMLFSNGSIR
jgi:hypothetical protein